MINPVYDNVKSHKFLYEVRTVVLGDFKSERKTLKRFDSRKAFSMQLETEFRISFERTAENGLNFLQLFVGKNK